MNKTCTQKWFSADGYDNKVTVTMVPESGFNGRDTIRVGLMNNRTDRELFTIDRYQAKSIGDALIAFAEQMQDGKR